MVLNAVPQIAEKHSRHLVPVLLRWVSKEEQEPTNEKDISSSDSPSAQRWGRKEQKAMLGLFSQFINPKVLYKSQEVFDALLSLLANGDAEIQRTALKAIFTWKTPSINRYEENLVNMLDDARFREQIAVFLDVGTDESTLQEEDRKSLMPVLLRLLYGRIVSRGSSSVGRGQGSKRKAVFIALSRFDPSDLDSFVCIALGPLEHIRLLENDQPNEALLQRELLTPRKQYGLVNMMHDMLETLGSA
ncbi:hypothetical protein LTS18_000977, partial [Coniosporium uncinatum]